MKKYLLNILGIFLVIYGAYGLIGSLVYLGSQGFSQTQLVNALLVNIFGNILVLITGIGLIRKKNWSIVLYWIALVFYQLAVSMVYTGQILLTTIGYVLLTLNVAIAIVLSTQWGTLSKGNNPA